MDSINEQKIANNRNNDKVIIKFQIQKKIGKPKCKS